MNKERLLKLADYLEIQMPIESWDYRHVVFIPLGLTPKTKFKPDDICGSTCCALGSVADIDQNVYLSAFNNSGILFNYNEQFYFPSAFAKLYFEIDEDTASTLFFGDGLSRRENFSWEDVRPKHIAKMIRQYVATGVVPTFQDIFDSESN